jgi:hypothetical protein
MSALTLEELLANARVQLAAKKPDLPTVEVLICESEREARLQKENLGRALNACEIVLAEIRRAQVNNVVWPSTVRLLESILAKAGGR